MKWRIIKKVSGFDEMLSLLRKKSNLNDTQLMELMGLNYDIPLETVLEQSDIARHKLTYLFCYEFVFK